MKLSVSNIGWPAEATPQVLDNLARQNVCGVEVAPTAHWGSWSAITEVKVCEFRRELEDNGFSVPALQSIFYGTDFTSIFDKAQHKGLLAHIRECARIAEWLEAKVLVFGSPKLRRIDGMSLAESTGIARKLFLQMGAICKEHGCIIGIENNPEDYGCEFLRTVLEVSDFVELVGDSGVGVHVDSAAVHLVKGDIPSTIALPKKIEHFHISEPFLDVISGGVVDHLAMFRSLQARNYNGWVSIEMKQPTLLEELYKSVSFIRTLLDRGV